ncbi:amidohydrolase [Gluconacetobacter asukensis]|uniref:Amidohydrolase n=1 Tax=Gluconacetobacter asukensis TaxID=1017181 RepID=A0A7W4J2H2_9PROT|nr:amidohydrolase [Gluconacetobacter asukensis]
MSTAVRIAMRRASLLLAASSLLAAHATLAAPAPPADILLTNGTIRTVDHDDRTTEALAIRDGRIVWTGSSADAPAHADAHTKTIDLKGHMVMPGLTDGHMHPLEGGQNLVGCSLDYLPLTADLFTARIRACAANPAYRTTSGWLVVRNWFQEAMQPAGLRMTKAALDSIDSTRPIIVLSSFGHSLLANSAALRRAGITKATPNPTGGQIIHGPDGQPTGILEDTALDLVMTVLPHPTTQENIAAASAALAAMRAQGITGFLDAWALPEDLDSFTALQKQGKLTARAHFAPVIEPAQGKDIAGDIRRLTTIRARYDQGPLTPAPSITVRNVKLFMDGVITAPSQTGLLLAPYLVNKGTKDHPDWQPGPSKGPAPYFPLETLSPLLKALVTAGFDPHMHADGDGAVRLALDAIAATRKALPANDFRPAIAHDEMVDPADMPRYRALNATPVLSFQWEKQAPDTTEGVLPYIGPGRAPYLEPASQMEKAGARITYGSDWPVDPLDEWFALKVGVTRTNAPAAGAQYGKPLGTEPGLSRASVMRAITINANDELRSDPVAGSLEPGKFADLIILDRDIATIPAEQIAGTRVLLTMVGGRIVYSTGTFSPPVR